MYSDDSARELAAAMRENAAASLELAATIKAAAAQLLPTAGMSHKDLQELADRQLPTEPPACSPDTHQGRVEQRVHEMLTMQYGGE